MGRHSTVVLEGARVDAGVCFNSHLSIGQTMVWSALSSPCFFVRRLGASGRGVSVEMGLSLVDKLDIVRDHKTLGKHARALHRKASIHSFT